MFLRAMRELVSYQLPKEVIQDTLQLIIEEHYMHPLLKKMKEETDENKKKAYQEEYDAWKKVIDEKPFFGIVKRIADKMKQGFKDNKFNAVIKLKDSEVEDAIAEMVSEIYKERVQLTNKAKTPKDFVNLINQKMQYDIIDIARSIFRHDQGENITHEDNKGFNKNLVEEMSDGKLDTDDVEFHDILDSLRKYITQHGSKTLIKIFDLWYEALKRGKVDNLRKSAPLLAKHFGVTDAFIYMQFKELQKMAVRFFENELDFKLPNAIKESLTLASKMSLEYKIAYEQHRQATARFVLGGVYADLQSGEFHSPIDMIKALKKDKK